MMMPLKILGYLCQSHVRPRLRLALCGATLCPQRALCICRLDQRKTLKAASKSQNLVGGLEHFVFSIYWE